MSILKNPAFWIIIAGMVFSLIGRGYISLAIKDSLLLDKKRNWTGYKAVVELLARYNINDVQIERREGAFNDKYFHRRKRLVLSNTSYEAYALSAIASALHEGGHVIQAREAGLTYRIVPVIAMIIRVLSMASVLPLTLAVIFRWWFIVQIVMYIFAFSVVFSLVTLSMEGQVSSYGLDFAKKHLRLDEKENEVFFRLMRANDFASVAAIFEPFLIIMNLFEPLKGSTKEERKRFAELAVQRDKEEKARIAAQKEKDAKSASE